MSIFPISQNSLCHYFLEPDVEREKSPLSKILNTTLTLELMVLRGMQHAYASKV